MCKLWFTLLLSWTEETNSFMRLTEIKCSCTSLKSTISKYELSETIKHDQIIILKLVKITVQSCWMPSGVSMFWVFPGL